jgi:hypothetical protein
MILGDMRVAASSESKIAKYINFITPLPWLVATAYIDSQIPFFGWVTICRLDF